ncbi:dihydrolipoyllysine-residue acetyltransferase [Nitrincola tibetensis]|uniref:Dihydrolipoamide acetyltransferase component of pyruvate dehydrogenase complex n=1 Tax=Nitrincola tibetensis TaxID=2219697 RepID=A0A364NJI8_9GAMM|nr:2-oxo acid dehydrogenase subunit E2 [Nitrincola tibetensis]RAU17055.1 dihydrolipoyllysine-residue acetyltransferase [Nitrincola tibetensis]
MKIDFILPDIGEGIVECELVEWHIHEGQNIQEDQPVADVMTDKALVEITSMHTGVITKLYYAQGEIAKVHQPLFEIEVVSDTEGLVVETEVADSKVACEIATPTDDIASATATNSALTCPMTQSSKAIASPAVRRLAREMSLDLTQVKGSGKNGRVLKEDLLEPSSVDATHTPAQPVSAPQSSGIRIEAIKGVRAVMARQMADSVRSIPHFTYAEEIDVTQLDAVRRELKPQFEAEGLSLSLMPFFMKALALSLQAYPILNSRLNEDATEIHYLDDINIGMAADTPIGLLVPNVKRVQDLSLLELTRKLNELTHAARQGKLSADDMKGGSITISNIGAIGGTVATPIINKPEVAIVALGRIQTLPRFDANGNVIAAKILHASWSGDHRLLDGATMARFCCHWKAYLENPLRMLAELK